MVHPTSTALLVLSPSLLPFSPHSLTPFVVDFLPMPTLKRTRLNPIVVARYTNATPPVLNTHTHAHTISIPPMTYHTPSPREHVSRPHARCMRPVTCQCPCAGTCPRIFRPQSAHIPIPHTPLPHSHLQRSHMDSSQSRPRIPLTPVRPPPIPNPIRNCPTPLLHIRSHHIPTPNVWPMA